MLANQTILDAVGCAAAVAASPLKIIVFGSCGCGDADDGSDLDLLVIERGVSDTTAEYMTLHRAIGPIGVGVDVLVVSQDEFERRSQANPRSRRIGPIHPE